MLCFCFLRNILIPSLFFKSCPFISALWLCHPISFWPPCFLMRIQMLILLEIPCMWWDVSLAVLRFCLHLVFWQFDYSVSQCQSLWCILHRVYWVFQIHKLIVLINSEYLAISSNAFSILFSLLFHLYASILHRLYSFFFILSLPH